MSTLVLRADGGPGIGWGHLGRCLALAQAWRDGGGEVALVAEQIPDSWRDRYRTEGVRIEQPGAPPPHAAWVVLDGYQLGASAQRWARSAGAQVAVIDDHGTSGASDADIVVDQNLGASASAYAALPSTARLLVGPSYALLRRDVLAARAAHEIAPDVARLAVALGGAAPSDLVATVDAALADARLAAIEPVRLRGQADVGALLATCDLAIAAAGSTSLELLAIGVPAVVLPIVDNQMPVARALADHDAAVVLRPSAAAEEIAAAASVLAGDLDARQQLSATGRALVDGFGARRVVAAMRAALLHLRPITPEDARLLWEWVNDPAVREAAFNSEPIPWEDHHPWVEQHLDRSRGRIYIAELAGVPVGQIRFARVGEAAVEIGFSLSAPARGSGLGAALLVAGLDRHRVDAPRESITARVKPANVASQRAFEVAGFELDGERSDGAHTWLQYDAPEVVTD
jgi:spore coat polysaccharide biosynthesis predicted glycosyltransferase SpsG/RimJ/RimL family protein N-acetyltransferase